MHQKWKLRLTYVRFASINLTFMTMFNEHTSLKMISGGMDYVGMQKKGFFSNALNSFHICMSSVVWQHSGLVKSIEGWAPPCIILTRSPKISPSPDWTVRQPSATRLPIHLGFGKYWHSELLHSARTFAIFDVDKFEQMLSNEHFYLTFHLPGRHDIDQVWILTVPKAQLNDHVGWVLLPR